MGSQKRALKRQVAKKTAQYLINGSAALEDELTNSKPWWSSKTLWVNVIALLALLAQAYLGFIIDAELQAALVVVINLTLRLVTSRPIAARDKAAGAKTVAVAALATLVLGLSSCGAPFTCHVATLELTDGAFPGDTRLEVSCDGSPVLQLESRGLMLSGQASHAEPSPEVSE